jgi:hypothetical protein
MKEWKGIKGVKALKVAFLANKPTFESFIPFDSFIPNSNKMYIVGDVLAKNTQV